LCAHVSALPPARWIFSLATKKKITSRLNFLFVFREKSSNVIAASVKAPRAVESFPAPVSDERAEVKQTQRQGAAKMPQMTTRKKKLR
jgi:hypothetical protein